MSAVTFDTLKYAKQLEAAGMPAMQAQAIVNAQRDILSAVLDSTRATKVNDHGARPGLVLFNRKANKLAWMLGITIALEAAIFAKQFF